MIRKHMIAHGRVQHVGFRYYCSHVAAECNVTGWAKNLYDGTVELEVQGADHRVERFIQEIKNGNRFIHVTRLDMTSVPLVRADQERGFRVRYD